MICSRGSGSLARGTTIVGRLKIATFEMRIISLLPQSPWDQYKIMLSFFRNTWGLQQMLNTEKKENIDKTHFLQLGFRVETSEVLQSVIFFASRPISSRGTDNICIRSTYISCHPEKEREGSHYPGKYVHSYPVYTQC